MEEVHQIISTYEKENSSKFVVWHEPKSFGKTAIGPSLDKVRGEKHRVFWDNHIPYMVLSKPMVYDCHHGKDRKVAFKKKYKERKKDGPDHVWQRHNLMIQKTKKLGCPARITVNEIMKFPQFKVEKDTESYRNKSSKAIKKALPTLCIENVRKELHVHLPDMSDHRNHPVGEGSGVSLMMDKRVLNYLRDMVREGVSTVLEMKRHLCWFVKNMFAGRELPPRTNRAFFPTKADIRAHMCRAKQKMKFSTVDQENLTKIIERWEQEPGHNIFYRPSLEDDDDDLLFIYQTDSQRRLLELYGNELAFLDATYKTTRYSLPLFFVVVKTNIDYQVVATFITESEREDAIREALKILAEWNPDWKPAHFMSDFCEAEIHSIEDVFDDCKVYLCDFHREQAWDRWLRKTDHNAFNDREEVLCRLRRIARAQSESEYKNAVDDLKASPVWENSKLCKWIENTWLPEYKRWVWAYRGDRLLVSINTNNGIERQNGVFKHEYLQKHGRRTLSGMVEILVTEFLPDQYQRYVYANRRASSTYRKYNDNVPVYLRNRPAFLIRHCLERLQLAEQIPSDHVIRRETDDSFIVKSQTDAKIEYMVDISKPSCHCYGWQHSRLPCKHIFAVFANTDHTWNSLPEYYKCSAFFVLDKVVTLSATEENADCQGASSSNDDGINTIQCDDDITDGIESTTNVTEYRQLPTKSHTPRARGPKCRELLKSINNLTYVLDDSMLKDVEVGLHQMYLKLKQSAHKSSGFIVEEKLPSKRKSEMLTESQPTTKTLRYSKLKMPKKRHPATGRFGTSAEMMKKNYLVNVNVQLNDRAPSV
ncbi:PREDICTED: uncharacterized protein LOC106819281 [Priapulus caudatus]|uniref:Uncharacterized protein LOC106819281 n=1 Tax=Priapulus caudatus TaxID=37621 RepID=A0ABM1F4P3_PRICU|nr:PREDICTED: uncharacterized protein LOC106819281 [Priapulus caudatus]